MSDYLYEVVFYGQIQEGAELDEVKARLAKLFKADAATIKHLFSGKRVVIKKNLTAEAADKYSIAITRAGAICELEPVDADSVAPVPASDRSARKAAPAAAAKKAAPRKRGLGKVAMIAGIAVVVIVVAAAAATPYVTGILAEQKYRESMSIFRDFAQQQSGGFTVTSDVDYRRGWLSSTAVNRITVEVPEQDPITFQLDSEINHGPYLVSGPQTFGLASIETTMPLSSAQKAEMAKIWKGNENPIQVRSHMDFVGKTVTEVFVAGFAMDNLDNDPEGKLRFEPMSTTITLSDHFTRADMDMVWNGMQIDSADEKVVIGKLTGRSQKFLSPQGLWLGDDEYSLSTVSVDASGAAAASMPGSSKIDKLAMVAHSEMDGGNLVKGYTTITAQDVVVANRSVASDLKLTIALERLEAKALQSITEKMGEQQKLMMQGGNTDPMPGMEMIQDEIAAILAAGPVLRITTLRATTEHGKVDADFEATIKVDDPAALQNPMFLLFAVQASGNVSVPAALVGLTPLAAFAPGFIEQGYIKNEQGQLKTAMKFRQGQLTLNGKVLQQ